MMEKLFNPSSIAVVGASADPSKIGNVVLRNLKGSGYRGNVYPVNPRGGEIMGWKVYKSIPDLPDGVDLAVIVLPAHIAVDAVEECGKKGIPFVIPIAGGFGETGEEGKKREERLKEIVQKHGTRIIGPNTVGIYVPWSGVNTALTVPERSSFPPAGDIAFISQSGALGLLTMDAISPLGVGISHFVNLGNRVDLNENELLAYFAGEEHVKSVAMYLETFANGREFMRVAREFTAKKGLVVLKAGRTAKGARAASLHTGALGGADGVVNGALRQVGAVRAYDEVEIIDYARALAYGKPMFGERVGVITTAGGVGVVTTDYIEGSDPGMGLRMADLSEETKKELRKELVPFASVENPVDMTASGDESDYDAAIGALMGDPNVDGIILYALFQTPLVSERLVDIVARWMKEGEKPIVVGVIGGEYSQRMMREFERRKVPVYPSILRTVKALKALKVRGDYLRRVRK
jgi:acyl-CoA synthetase (NDP forming)